MRCVRQLHDLCLREPERRAMLVILHGEDTNVPRHRDALRTADIRSMHDKRRLQPASGRLTAAQPSGVGRKHAEKTDLAGQVPPRSGNFPKLRWSIGGRASQTLLLLLQKLSNLTRIVDGKLLDFSIL
jgi:hypothetical protein